MNGQPRGVGVQDVVWFNYPLYLAALAVVVVGTAILGAALVPAPLTFAVVYGTAVAGWWLVASIAASAWVFNLSGATRWAWVPAALGGRPGSWLNITSGFDDTTERLRIALGAPGGTSVDVFDGRGRHDGALRRARAAFPPAGPTVRPGDALPVADGSQDAVLLLMSAHELERGAVRDALFDDIVRALRVGGRVLVVEFAGDRWTFGAFGPGAFHFESTATWRTALARAGLRRVEVRRLAFLARAFVYERPPTA